jgi:hypothetical protein
VLLVLGLLAGWMGCGQGSVRSVAAPAPDVVAEGWPQYVLTTNQWWLLNLPGGRRFDASGLVRMPDGAFWTVNDQFNAVYRMRFPEAGVTNAIDLEPVAGLFTMDQVAAVSGSGRLRLDCEGLGRDAQGRLYICEESRRMILRWDPATTRLEKLPIDWTPVRSFFDADELNASFEGVAVGGDRLYVANERQLGRIVVVDLATLQVVDHFAVGPAGNTSKDVHYSDLSWADGALWVLLRDLGKVLKVDPVAKRVLAEFDYAALERASATAYGLIYAPGFMEGLVVDDEFIWLLVDNNGFRRRARAGDLRPTLFQCRRPDVARFAR